MKTAIMSLMLILALAIGVSASGFEVDKYTSVTGDWKWDNGWQYGNWQTAVYEFNGVSPLATSAYYVEPFERIGTAWEYELEAHTGTNAPTQFTNEFHAWTVNDPDTTPATGGYTRYQYNADNYGDYSESHLAVSGEGAVDVSTFVDGESAMQQDVYVGVNY